MFNKLWNWIISLFTKIPTLPPSKPEVVPTPEEKPAPIKPEKPVVPEVDYGNPIRGIDVSHYKPGVNWAEVKKTCPFAFMKATEGLSGVDSLFKNYWKQMKDAGVIRGAYHFFHPNLDPVAQAKHFLVTVGKLEKTDLPPVLDFEVHGGISNAAQIANALKWLEYVKAQTGVTPIVYTSPSFIKDIGNPEALGAYPLWLAHYGVKKPRVPAPWKTWTFWQDSESGKVKGVPSSVDTNWFKGSLDDLKTFIAKQQGK